MSAGTPWGPFTDGLDQVERVARLRSLRALVRVLCGPRGAELADKLRLAERDEAAIEEAATAFGKLGTIDRRRVLASYGPLLP